MSVEKAQERVRKAEEELRAARDQADQELRRVQEEGCLETMPKMLDNPNFRPLRELAESAMKVAAEEGRPGGKDIDHYAFEAVMVAFYGPGIWDWWNKYAYRNGDY